MCRILTMHAASDHCTQAPITSKYLRPSLRLSRLKSYARASSTPQVAFACNLRISDPGLVPNPTTSQPDPHYLKPSSQHEYLIISQAALATQPLEEWTIPQIRIAAESLTACTLADMHTDCPERVRSTRSCKSHMSNLERKTSWDGRFRERYTCTCICVHTSRIT
jgi:hypothetical protein